MQYTVYIHVTCTFGCLTGLLLRLRKCFRLGELRAARPAEPKAQWSPRSWQTRLVVPFRTWVKVAWLYAAAGNHRKWNTWRYELVFVQKRNLLDIPSRLCLNTGQASIHKHCSFPKA